jgi:hypothetical protein
MTDRTTYNGWTNYATWRVCLEIFDGRTWKDYFGTRPDVDDLRLALKDHVESLIYEAGGGGGNIAVDYALAFIDDVNWDEIAQHLLEDEELPDEVAE